MRSRKRSRNHKEGFTPLEVLRYGSNAVTRRHTPASPAANHISAAVTGPLTGFTLAETLVTIGLVAVLLAVYTTVLFSAISLRRSQYNIQASLFIQEELDTLRALPFTELLNRTDGRFLGISMTRGPWQVKTFAGAPSGANVLAMETAQSAIIEETGIAILPGNYHEVTTYTAKVQALPSSPSGWGAGVALRYRDPENHYRFRFTSGGIAFDRVHQGVKTTLWSQSAAYSTGTWYTLEAVAAGPAFILKRNGAVLGSVNDTTLETGDLALITLNGANAYFDDITSNEVVISPSWNFDSDTAGELPTDWQRLSIFDLPNGAGTLTVENYLGQVTLKKITTKVSWDDAGKTRSMSGSTLIAK